MTPALDAHLDAHPLKTRVGDFIAGLKHLEEHPITTAGVLDYLAEMQLSAEALAPYTLWSSERYTRNLIYRDDWFEVIALCWLPGQRTPIHTHNGQLGWVTVVQGELVCRDYRFVRPSVVGPTSVGPSSLGPTSEELQAPKKKCASSWNDSAEGRRVEVELVASATCVADGSVAVVDRRRTTHQLANLEQSRYGSVSLHVYSKPIDCCVLFDESSRCCQRRPLRYHSADGVILKEAA
jgi:cysteine dioxygenase